MMRAALHSAGELIAFALFCAGACGAADFFSAPKNPPNRKPQLCGACEDIMAIIIATYQHKHGSDTRAFATAALAEAWRQEIAADNWDGGPNEDMPADPHEAADRYFEFGNDLGHEFYATESTEVEGIETDPVRDAAPALLAALRDLYELCTLGASPDAFRNGVTDSSGTIDEGDVRVSARLDAARIAIAAAEGAR